MEKTSPALSSPSVTSEQTAELATNQVTNQANKEDKQTKKSQTDLNNLPWQQAHETEIQVRYADLDTLGHVNNVAYLQYAEVSRIHMNIDYGLDKTLTITPIVHISIDYIAEIKFGLKVVAQTLIVHIGRTSFTTITRLLYNDKPCTFIKTVLVNADKSMQPAVIPDEARVVMQRHLLPAQ